MRKYKGKIPCASASYYIGLYYIQAIIYESFSIIFPPSPNASILRGIML